MLFRSNYFQVFWIALIVSLMIVLRSIRILLSFVVRRRNNFENGQAIDTSTDRVLSRRHPKAVMDLLLVKAGREFLSIRVAMEMQVAGHLMIHLLHPQVPEEIQEATVAPLVVRAEGMDSILLLTPAHHRVVAAVALVTTGNGTGSGSVSGND